jgi:hypothetical protein
MLFMQITDFYKQYTPTQIKKASKLTVREWDVENNGKHIAYVDEGDQSYDVYLQIENDNILEFACDCGKKQCIHLLTLLKQTTATTTKSSKTILPQQKKTGKFKSFFDPIPTDQKLEWLFNLLESDKKIQLLFLNHFQIQEEEMTTAALEAKTAMFLKTVIRSKKNATPHELKNLVTLLDTLYAPFVNNYITSPTNDKHIDFLIALLQQCVKIRNAIITNSNKLDTYITNKIINPVCIGIASITNMDDWKLACKMLSSAIKNSANQLREISRDLFVKILELEPKDRQLIALEQILQIFKEDINKEVFKSLREYILCFCKENELILPSITYIMPTRFNNESNLMLLEQLLTLGENQLVIAHCNTCINSNFYDYYNKPYFVILKKVYTKTGNQVETAYLNMELLTDTLSISDFDFALKHIKNEEKLENSITKAINAVKVAANGFVPGAEELLWHIFASREMYTSMINRIGETTNYEIILQYFDTLILQNRKLLLQCLLLKRTFSGQDSWLKVVKQKSRVRELDLQNLEKMYSKIIDNYIYTEIKDAFLKIKSYQTNTAALLYYKVKKDYFLLK